MKVLHVETGMHLYGGALQVAFLIRGLRARGVTNVMVCPRGSAIAQAAADDVDCLHAVPMAGDFDLAFVPRLRRRIRAEHPDVVHLHSRRGADVLGALAARPLGIPIVMSRRVDNPESRRVVRVKYRLYDRVITISEGIRQVLLSEGLATDKVVCVHSAVDTELYRPGGDRDWFRDTFGMAHDQIAIGMAAQMIERKGHRTLLRALPAVIAEHPDLRVLLFGQGPLRAELEREVRAQQLDSHVRFEGFRDDLPRVLPCLDLLVHPARMEGLGVALLQAASCGVPIVAGRAGGIPEIVHDGDNGFLVEPDDVSALARALAQLCGDADLRRRFGARGREIALRNFSIDAMVEGNLRVYQTLVEPGRTAE